MAGCRGWSDADLVTRGGCRLSSVVQIANPLERVVGCYVYLLLCRDTDEIYIKVGISETPWNRFLQLAANCAVTPRSFSMIAAPSRGVAVTVERSLHLALDRWRKRGEWFAFSASDKREFNSILHGTLSLHATSEFGMDIEKLSADALLRLAKERRRAGYAALKRIKRRYGAAYADFWKHSGAKIRQPTCVR